ncbi:hypothetical protein ABEB36_002758 [Hypothenemus hampei]|uniref:CHK kinase-like domain-containing protein n=1 Tax=Hypothenemus hampei TaxID=57062 RepID=A0ABD1F9Z8_HYPHA
MAEHVACYGTDCSICRCCINLHRGKPALFEDLDLVLQYHFGDSVKLAVSELLYNDKCQVVRSYLFRSILNVSGSMVIEVKKPEPKDIVLYVFVKLSPRVYSTNKLMAKMQLIQKFQKEQYLYTKMITEFTEYQIQSTEDCPKDKRFVNLFPICYGTREPYANEDAQIKYCGLTILENLVTSPTNSYIRVKPTVDLTLEEEITIIKKMALMHAVPLALKAKETTKFKTYLPFLTDMHLIYKKEDRIHRKTKILMEYIAKIPSLRPYVEIIKANLRESLKIEINSNDKWVGFAHGELSAFNICIKQSKKMENIDAKFLDLQHAAYRHVLSDVAFFFLTTLTENHLKNHYNKLTQAYYDTFQEIIRSLDGDEDSFGSYETFETELRFCIRAELFRAVMHLKYLCAHEGRDENIQSLSSWYDIDDAIIIWHMSEARLLRKLEFIFQNLFDLNILSRNQPIDKSIVESDSEEEDVKLVFDQFLSTIMEPEPEPIKASQQQQEEEMIQTATDLALKLAEAVMDKTPQQEPHEVITQTASDLALKLAQAIIKQTPQQQDEMK